MTYKLSTPRYAAIYGCSTRTITRYRNEDAPLDDPPAIFDLWAANKLTPPAALAKGQEIIVAEYAAAVGKPVAKVARPPATAPLGKQGEEPRDEEIEKPSEGAEHALQRLEELEATAHRELILANKSGDPVRIKRTLDGYLKISESLRRYDSQVADSRRDSGQMIPRAEAELAIEMAATWLRLSVRSFISSTTPQLAAAKDLPVVAGLIEDGMAAGVRANLMRAPKCQAALQPWALECIRKGYSL